MIISSYTHFLADNVTLFFFVAKENYIVYMHCIFSTRSSAVGHLGWSNIVCIIVVSSCCFGFCVILILAFHYINFSTEHNEGRFKVLRKSLGPYFYHLFL